MSTIDLKDAYYLVSVDKAHRKYLRSSFNGVLYEFTCLPFGLATAPRVFTKIVKPVVSYLRQEGLQSVVYLDDFLLFGNTKNECQNNVTKTRNFLINLGFIIHDKKCQSPTQRCKYLGFEFDSRTMTIELPLEKRTKIKTLSQKYYNITRCTIRKFAHFIGSLVACCPALKYSPVYIKNFERQKYLALEKNNGNFDAIMKIQSEKGDFKWWERNIEIGFNLIEMPEYHLEIFSDASLTGWGAVCGQSKTNGFWSNEEKKSHINFLELTAAFFGIQCFAKKRRDINILLRIDNTTAIFYINKMGGIQIYKLNKL